MLSASLGADDRTVQLQVRQCSGPFQYELEGDSEQVTVTVEQIGPFTEPSPSCLAGLEVIIGEDLSGRQLVDGSTNRPIRLVIP